MCLGIYVASERDLPQVPFDPATPAFNITALDEHQDPVRSQFSLPSVVYAGAHTSCGCGFSENHDDDPDAVARSRAALIEYLQGAIAAGPLEPFICWDGDYTEPPAERLTRRVADLKASTDWLNELTFVRLAA